MCDRDISMIDQMISKQSTNDNNSGRFSNQDQALEDQEVAKKAEEREKEKIYDTIDSEDQKKIDELYEKKPINS